MVLPRTRVHKVHLCGSELFVEDVLDLLERVRENTGEPDLRLPRILAGVRGLARYEDRGYRRLTGRSELWASLHNRRRIREVGFACHCEGGKIVIVVDG